MSDQAVLPAPAATSARGWQCGWGIIFLMNLPLPLLLGCEATRKGGLGGMLAAVAVVWLAGHVAVSRLPSARGSLVLGGGFIALTQGFPLLQGLAGYCALSAVGYQLDERLTDRTAFAVTVLTAGELVAAGLVGALAFRGVLWTFEGRANQEG